VATYDTPAITQEFLDINPNCIYVFPDNIERTGSELCTQFRDHEQAYGFIAKKFPDTDDSSYFRPEEYSVIFFEELSKLKRFIKEHPDKTFYVANMCGPSVNKYRIWELLMVHNIVAKLEKFENVVFCW